MPDDNLMPNFEEFRGVGSRMGTHYISITGNGTITLFAGFYQKESIGKYNNVLLLYDKAKKIIGLKFSESDDMGKGVATVNKQDGRNNAWIAAGNFFKHYSELNLAELKGKYEPIAYGEANGKKIYGIDLTKKLVKNA